MRSATANRIMTVMQGGCHAWMLCSRQHREARCACQVLIADFFFVCAALAWLLAGVGAKTALDSSVRTLSDCAVAANAV